MPFANPVLLFKMLILSIAGGTLLLVAHLVWIAQLSRSSDVRSCSGWARATILVIAATTPLVSYYVIAAIRHARETGAGSVQRFAPMMALMALAIVTTLATVMELRFDERAMNGVRGTYALALNRSIGASLAFLLLFMAVRVLAPFRVRGSAVIALVLLAGIILLLI